MDEVITGESPTNGKLLVPVSPIAVLDGGTELGDTILVEAGVLWSTLKVLCRREELPWIYLMSDVCAILNDHGESEFLMENSTTK